MNTRISRRGFVGSTAALGAMALTAMTRCSTIAHLSQGLPTSINQSAAPLVRRLGASSVPNPYSVFPKASAAAIQPNVALLPPAAPAVRLG